MNSGALDQSAEQFAQDADAQAELFAAAEKMSAQQNDLARRIHVEDVGGRGTVTISKTKRPTPAELREAILDKMKDRKYKAVGEMDDIVRARYDAEDPADVEAFVKGLQQDPTFSEIQRPQAREGVAWGYPRYHVIMKDAETGLTHEWQIGTRASTELFERKGIRLGNRILPNCPHASFGDLHDIEYDIFKKIQKAEPDVAAHFKIPEYRRELAEFSAKTGLQRMDPDELERGIVEFHERASKILAELIDEKGLGYVESYQKK
jgi:hypothetical protein